MMPLFDSNPVYISREELLKVGIATENISADITDPDAVEKLDKEMSNESPMELTSSSKTRA